MLVVALAHERHRRSGRKAIEDGQAGQGGSGAPVAASASDLNSLRRGAQPGFGQRGSTAARNPRVQPQPGSYWPARTGEQPEMLPWKPVPGLTALKSARNLSSGMLYLDVRHVRLIRRIYPLGQAIGRFVPDKRRRWAQTRYQPRSRRRAGCDQTDGYNPDNSISVAARERNIPIPLRLNPSLESMRDTKLELMVGFDQPR